MKFFVAVVISFLLGGCQSKPSADRTPAKLRLETHTAAEAGFLVNSHLIIGDESVILIDAQFTRSEARQVVERIQRTGKKLTTVFITHGHPDHYFGLEVIKKAYPDASIVATTAVIQDIESTGKGKLESWKKTYKDELTDTVVVPSALKGDSLTIDGNVLKVTELGIGESAHAAVIYIPSNKALVSGDLIYNQVHLWLAEDQPSGWLANLKKAQELGPIETVLSGHGVNGGPQLFADNVKYVEEFDRITKAKGATMKSAVKKLVAAYPNHRLPVIAELSVSSRLGAQKSQTKTKSSK